MAKVTRIKGVNRLLRRLGTRPVVAAVTGYTAKYALFVHENMEPKTLGLGIPRPSGLGVYWGPSQYGPKFLEGPARQHRRLLVDLIRGHLIRGTPMMQALLIGALRLQRESMLLVPVEYGNLRASAFTEEDKEFDG